MTIEEHHMRLLEFLATLSWDLLENGNLQIDLPPETWAEIRELLESGENLGLKLSFDLSQRGRPISTK